MPTERFSFQSGYFHNLQMSGSFAYSTGDTVVSDFLEAQDFFASRTLGRGSLTNGPAEAKQFSATADFMAVYSSTTKCGSGMSSALTTGGFRECGLASR